MRGILVLIGICLGSLNANAWFPGDSTAYRIDTVAGSDWVGDNGLATLAILKQAEGIAADSAGNLYVADAANHRVRKVSRTSVITTLAGTGVAGFSGDGGPSAAAQLNAPYGLASDGQGNIYIADLGNARIRRIGTDGMITTIAGGGSLAPGDANDGSPATMIKLSSPRNVALDGRGALFFSDFNGHRVYRIDLTAGAMTAVAGTGASGTGGGSGLATQAQLSYPTALGLDRNGSLYIADSQNHAIRKVTAGIISTFAHVTTPTGLIIDGFGTVYVADPAVGQILTFPVNGKPAVYSVAALDLGFGSDGYLYASQGQSVIRVAYSGASTIVAGGGSLASGDQGPATNALLQGPNGVAVDTVGNMYVADQGNHRIRKVAPDGTISTIAGTGEIGDLGDGGLAAQAQLSSPSSVTVDTFGNLYIADTGNHRIRKVNPVGVILPVSFPNLNTPVYAAADSGGNIFVADAGVSSGNGAILKRTPAGAITQLANHLGSPGGFALDGNNNLYFTDTKAKRVRRLDNSGVLTAIADGAWTAPTGVIVGANHDLFVADAGLAEILRVDAEGNVTVVAGTGLSGFSGDGGDAAAAQVNGPAALAIDAQGTIYISDLGNNRVRRLTPAPAAIIAPLQSISALNTASQQPGPIAPGMLLDLTGTGLRTADQPNIQVLFQTDSSLSASQVLSVNSKRIEVRVPSPLTSATGALIQIWNNSNLVAQISAAVSSAAPGLFADATGQAIAINEDGTLNSAANPAARGSIVVLYGTGEGTNGQTVSVNIGGYSADVLYAGPVPGFPGLLQINARVPSGYIGTGALAVSFIAGDTPSQSGVVINLN